MPLSYELWNDCWSILIFTCGDRDIINHCQRKERSFNATVRWIVEWLLEYSNLYMWRHGHNEITAKGKKEEFAWRGIPGKDALRRDTPCTDIQFFWLVRQIVKWFRGAAWLKRFFSPPPPCMFRVYLWYRVSSLWWLSLSAIVRWSVQWMEWCSLVEKGFISLVAKFQCHCQKECPINGGIHLGWKGFISPVCIW